MTTASSPRPRGFGTARRVLALARRYPWRFVEIAALVYVAGKLFGQAAFMAEMAAMGDNLRGSLQALSHLLAVDARATLASVGLAAFKLVLMLLPLLGLAWRRSAWQKARTSVIAVASLAFWPLTIALPLPWIAAMAVSTLVLQRVAWLRWTVALPWLLIASLALNHLGGSLIWTRAALVERCADNDGVLPENVRPSHFNPGYMGISPVAPGQVLLTGQRPEKDRLPLVGALSHGPDTGGSWWLQRGATGWRLGDRSTIEEMFWQGCTVGGELWLAQANSVVAVRRDSETGREIVRQHQIRDDPSTIEINGVACFPDLDRVYSTDGVSKSVIEVDTRTGAIRTLSDRIGGLPHNVARRGWGHTLVAATGSHLVTYSIDEERVLARTPAAVQSFLGLDVCQRRGEVALADISGRVRFFEALDGGAFRFVAGVSLRAPRIVKYSPDCRHLAVTSMDDTTVWLVDRETLAVQAVYAAGPALRGVTFVAPRQFAVADACTMSTFTY